MQLTHSINDQLMATAAHRYCLGRRSYIVGACLEWLREIWPQLTANSQNTMLRDTIESLHDNRAGDRMDEIGWIAAAQWMWESMTPEQRERVQHAVDWKGIADVGAWLSVDGVHWRMRRAQVGMPVTANVEGERR